MAGKLCLDQAIVAMDVKKAEQQETIQQQRVVTDVRFAFYDVLVAQRRDETANQLVDIARDAVATATALLAVKDISEADMMRSRIELQSAQLMLKNAGNRYIGAWIRLIAVTGVSDLQPQPLDGDVEQTMERIDADDVLARLVSESPEMAVALSEVERARRVVARARAEPIGNVDVQAVVQSDNGTGSSNANLQVSLPIPWLNSNQGGIRQARGGSNRRRTSCRATGVGLQAATCYRLSKVRERSQSGRGLFRRRRDPGKFKINAGPGSKGLP